jgi:hypothetical protein
VLWLWLPLAFFLVVLVAGAAACVLRGLRAYRQLRALVRAVLTELAGFEERLHRTQREAEAAAAGGERLTAALERLAESRRRLAVLGAALRVGALSRGPGLLRAR